MIEMDVQLTREDVNFSFQCRIEDPVAGVFGPSGAGKTTLLRILSGLEPDAVGLIRHNHQILLNSAERKNPPARRRRVGLVDQDNRLFPHLSVLRNLRYGEKLTPARERRIALDEVVKQLEIEPLLKRNVGNLSGGEIKRIMLGRVLLTSPGLLLLDEPFTGLEKRLSSRLIDFLHRLHHRHNMTVWIVSHHLSEILSFTETLMLISGRRIVASGEYEDLLSDPALSALLQIGELRNLTPQTPAPRRIFSDNDRINIATLTA